MAFHNLGRKTKAKQKKHEELNTDFSQVPASFFDQFDGNTDPCTEEDDEQQNNQQQDSGEDT